MTDKILTTSLESANSALELANIAIEKLKAELDDHCQQLRKEQLAVQSLHEKLAELAAQEPVGRFRKDHLAHAQRGAFFVGAHKEKDFDDLVPLYAAPGAKQ